MRRQAHSFFIAPNAGLVSSVLRLSPDPLTAAKDASQLAHELAYDRLSPDPSKYQDDSMLEAHLEIAGLVADILSFAARQLASLADRWAMSRFIISLHADISDVPASLAS